MLTNSEQNFLRPVQPEEFLPPISRWTTWGGLFLVGTFGVAIAVAALTKYNVTVKAPATVRPAGEVRIVQAATAGTVKTILVKENQVVKQGEAIAIIDDSRLQTQKSQLQTNLEQNQRQVNQINAQIIALNQQIRAESDRSQRTIASAIAQLSRSQRDYRDKQITTIAEVQEAEAALELATEEVARYRKLSDTGAIAQLQLKEKEAGLKTAIARLEQVKAALNPSNADITISSERIAQEKATGVATLATLTRERFALTQQRIQITNQIQRDKQELKQIQTDLQSTIISASTSGTILQLNLRNSSQVVNLGETIAQIAPSHAPLVIKALVPSQDISKLKTAQTVEMRVSACPYPDYGTLKGIVKAISPDAITPEKNSSTNPPESTTTINPFYEVTIQPENLKLIAHRRYCTIQAGMEGRADIIAREETVLTFILRKARLLTDV